MWYTHTVKYSVMKRNEVLKHATTWMKLEYIMLKEVSHKGSHCTIPFV